MSTNRRRHANTIPLASFAMWGVIALFALVGSLAYVWCKNQLYTTGTEIKGYERELSELKNKNEVVVSKINQLIATAKLQERYAAGFFKAEPITNDRIVLLQDAAQAPQSNELRPAANERTAE